MHATPSPTPDPEDAWLEDLLRRDDSTSHNSPEAKASAQFTERVLAALPPSPTGLRRARNRHRLLLIGGAALAGALAAWWFGGPGLAMAWQELLLAGPALADGLRQPDSSLASSIAVGASVLLMLLLAGRGTLRRLFS